MHPSATTRATPLRHAWLARPLTALALAGTLSSTLTGCAGNSSESAAPAGVALTTADFADPSAPAPPRATATMPTQEAQRPGARPRTTVGAPTVTGTAENGERVLVDAIVGQVNGVPVFAEEFYRDSRARWISAAERMPPRQWTTEIRNYTQERLFNFMRDELLLAEFRASLNPQQRQGVLNFVEDLRENIISGQGGGSTEQAEQWARENEGVSLDELVERQAEREFIIAQLRTAISNRVQVSTRDIEFYYNRNIEKYQPPAQAVIRQVQKLARDEDQIAAFNQTIAETGSIPDDEGQIVRVALKDGAPAEELFGSEELNSALADLRPGRPVGPITSGSLAYWFELEEIDQPEGQSLYDVQLEIEEILQSQRLREEETRYFERLFERSNVSDMNEMISGLLNYAVERFYAPVAEERGG